MAAEGGAALISRNIGERQAGSVVNNPVSGRRPIVLPVGASVRARCSRALCRRRPATG